MPTESAELTNYFKEKWEETYGKILPINKKMSHTYMKRFISWFTDYFDAHDFIDWLFENWEKLYQKFPTLGATPSISVLGSSSWIKSLKDIQAEGFAVTTKDRVSVDDSPDKGWGDI